MSKNTVQCGECGTNQNSYKMTKYGCWYCQLQVEYEEDRKEFESFMFASELDRWYALWLACGKPDAYGP